jgi:hypothetical protein
VGEEPRQLCFDAGLGVGDDAGRVLLRLAVQRGPLGAMAFLREPVPIQRPLGLQTEGMRAGLPNW